MLLGQVKLMPVLQYGVYKTATNEHGSYLPVYTKEQPGSVTVGLTLKQLYKEMSDLKVQSILVDPKSLDLKISKIDIYNILELVRKASGFKLKLMPFEKTVELENKLRASLKKHSEIDKAWLLGIMVPGEDEYKYVLILEYNEAISALAKRDIHESLAEKVYDLLPGEEFLIGSSDELAGSKAKADFAPFFIRRTY